MLKYSQGLRDAMLVTGPLRDLLNDSQINVYSGPEPAGPDNAIGGATLLLTINNGGLGVTFEPTVANATLTKSLDEVWSGVTSTTGTATFFRVVKASDSGDTSFTEYRIQGRVAIAGADMNLTNPNLAEGATQTLDYFYLTMPES